MQNNLVFGAILLLLAELCFAGLSAMVKFLSEHLSQTQLVFFRNLFTLLVLLPFIRFQRLPVVRTSKFHLHLLRTITGLAGMYCFVYVLTVLPLAQATLAMMMSPFIIPLVAQVILKESITPRTWIGIALGFFGAAVFLQLGQFTLDSALIFALMGAFMVAVTKVLLRQMSKTDSTFSIIFYFALLSSLFSAIPLLNDWQPLSRDEGLGLLLIGVLASAGQWLMTRAFSVAPAGKIGLFGFSSIIFAGIIGATIWHEPFGIFQLAGTIIIISAGFLALKSQSKQA